jgi:hypothetical protein
MSRIGIAIAILIVAVFSGILLWGMFFSHIEAVSALSALKLEFMAPVKVDVDWTRGKLTIGLIGIVENTGSRDIEIEGGEYKIYIIQGGMKHTLVAGQLAHLHIKAYSSQLIPLSAELSLLELPRTLRSLIEAGSGFQIYIEILLKIPIKLGGITLWTYPITISKTI